MCQASESIEMLISIMILDTLAECALYISEPTTSQNNKQDVHSFSRSLCFVSGS